MAYSGWPFITAGILALLVLFGIFGLWRILKEKRSGFPLSDERTQKLNGKAAYYAMFLSQYFILGFLAVSIVGGEFFGMPEFEAGYPMIAALLVSSVSFLVLRQYFDEQGEP